jgi:hypothetical protein
VFLFAQLLDTKRIARAERLGPFSGAQFETAERAYSHFRKIAPDVFSGPIRRQLSGFNEQKRSEQDERDKRCAAKPGVKSGFQELAESDRGAAAQIGEMCRSEAAGRERKNTLTRSASEEFAAVDRNSSEFPRWRFGLV